MSHHYPTITPHLGVSDGAAALDFYAKAFGAKEETRFQTAGRHRRSTRSSGSTTRWSRSVWPSPTSTWPSPTRTSRCT